MKKILILLKHLSLGGAEKMFLRIIKTFNICDYEIHIKLVFNESIYDLSFLPNVKVSSIFDSKNEDNKLLIKNVPKDVYAKNILEKYDVEIAFLEGYATQIIGASDNPDSLKIAFIHTDFRFFHHSLNSYRNERDEFECYKKFHHLVFVSKTARVGFFEIYPNLIYLKSSICYPPLTDNMLLSYNTKNVALNDKPYFITLTRLAPEKGLFKLIAAAKKLRNSNFDVCFKIYGIGPMYESIKEMIVAENLEKYILLMGYNDSPYYDLKNSLAYICPSDNESFCIAIQEAMFLSVPIIACRSYGTEEILNNGEFGLLVDNNSDGLYNGIYQFMSDYTLQNNLIRKSKNGKKHWQKKVCYANDFSPFILPNSNI